MITQTHPYRLLVIDDNPSGSEEFRKILSPQVIDSHSNAVKAALFGQLQYQPVEFPYFDLDFAYQGEEGIQMVRKALENRTPYAALFLNTSIPPGIDGVETVNRIFRIDPFIQVILYMSASDFNHAEVYNRLGQCDRLVILKKPFEPIELRQLAFTLAEKWSLAQRLQNQVQEMQSLIGERTTELENALALIQDSHLSLSELKKQNEECMSLVAIDVRSALHLVVESSTILSEETLAMLTEKQKKLVFLIRKAFKSLLASVNQILLNYKGEDLPITLKKDEVKLIDFLQEIVDYHMILAQKKKIEFKFDNQLKRETARFDKSKIGHVIYDFLSNAFKLAPIGSLVTLVAISDKNFFRIEVKDKAERNIHTDPNKLFTSFPRLPAQIPNSELVHSLEFILCKQIIESQGGQIGFAINPSQGSTFYFKIDI